MVSRSRAGSKPGAHPVRIGLWGASNSGKTTFLGALKLAAQQTRGRSVVWTVMSKNPAGQSVMSELASRLVNERQFPATTQANTPLSWSFLGETRNGTAKRVEFTLDLLDVSGKLFADGFETGEEFIPDEDDELSFDGMSAESSTGLGSSLPSVNELVDHLVTCDGIIFLFDPIREEQDRDSFSHFNAMLDKVVSTVHQSGRMIGTVLPHHLAICVTKFDDPRVLGRALQPNELAELGTRTGPIKIDRNIAFRYFEELCRERPNGTAQYVRDAIRGAFIEDRIRYYATSSVGFFHGPDGTFDPADYSNVVSAGGTARIRGRVEPMNVLEPLVAMVSRIRQSSRAGAVR